MERTDIVQKSARNIVQGIGAFLCCLVSVMGCYPLIPAYFAVVSLTGEGSLLLYAGLLMGMGWKMSLPLCLKYILIALVTGLALRFYIWANRSCGGLAAGILAGGVTTAMSLSGQAFYTADRNTLILALCEGLLVCGITVAFHRGLQWIEEGVDWIRSGPFFVREISPGETGYDPEGKVAAFASAVDGLSATFTTLSQRKERTALEEVGALEQEITGKLCGVCDGCVTCWNENRAHLSGRIRSMLQAVMEHVPKEEIVRKAYVTDCPRYFSMVEEAVNAFGRMELNQAWYKRLLENRMAIAQQLDAMAELLGDYARGNRNLDGKSRVLLAKIAFEAKEKGIYATDVHIYGDENKRKYVTARVSSKWGGGIPTKNYVKALEKAMHTPMRVQQSAKSIITREEVFLTVYEDTGYYALPGVALRKKNGSAVSGDSYALFQMDNGNYYACLSDGMGSGSRASQESELVVDLLQKFLEAGFAKETAIKMMNSAMVLQGEDSTFSTLDLAEIDLYGGRLNLVKIGAAATFIKRETEVEWVASTSLPAGVEYELSVEKTQKQLKSGDFLVMVTDGVLEYLHAKNPEEKLKDMICEIETDNAGALARGILDRVLLATGDYALDDMTVVAVGIWEK